MSEQTTGRERLNEARPHGAVALAHWYLGQALLKLKNGHHDDAATAILNADRFVSVVGKEVAPDLYPLPDSLRQALIAHGCDPDLPSVKSAESWSPPITGNPDALTDGLEEQVEETLRRMGHDLG